MPEIKMVRSPYPGPDGGDGEELVAMPALELDMSFVHMNRADRAGNGQFLGPDLYMDDWFVLAAQRTFMSTEQIIPTDDFAKHGSFHTQRISRLHIDGVIEAPNGAHFTECPPDYGRDEAFQREYALAAGSPERWQEFAGKYLELESEADYQRVVGAEQMSGTDFTRADVCAVAMAECFRGDGEWLCNPIGTIPMIGGRLARETFEPLS